MHKCEEGRNKMSFVKGFRIGGEMLNCSIGLLDVQVEALDWDFTKNYVWNCLESLEPFPCQIPYKFNALD